MAQSRIPTRISEVSNAVVLVGGEARLVNAVGAAALNASGAHVLRADVSSSATVCAESRPYAIVLPSDIYDFGGSEFDALARDLNAGLVVVPVSIQVPVLTALLMEEAARLG